MISETEELIADLQGLTKQCEETFNAEMPVMRRAIAELTRLHRLQQSDTVGLRLLALAKRIQAATAEDDKDGIDFGEEIHCVQSELGEVCTARHAALGRREMGKETAWHESVDVLNCALALVFAADGELSEDRFLSAIDRVVEYGNIKVDKWFRNIEKRRKSVRAD